MKTLNEKIVESIIENIPEDRLRENGDVLKDILKQTVKEIIRNKENFDIELNTTLVPKLLNTIEELS